MRLISGWERHATHPENLLGYSFIIEGKVGRRTSLSFLSRCHASNISFSSSLSREVFLSLRGQARSINDCFSCVQSMSQGSLTY